MVYVLTTRVEKEWRPVAVVDEANRDTAEQWAAATKNNDWVPLEMNDLSLTDLGNLPTTFKPLPMGERSETAMKTLEATNTKLIGIIEQLAERYKDKNILKVIQKIKTGSEDPFESELLRKQ
jgi:hypothetical protein